MNEPNKLREGRSESSFCKFGSETLLRLLGFFEEQIGGVTESEYIEYVHRMRVTSRRFRAALPLFAACFPRKKFKNWRREIKKVTRLLGEARDLDVQIAFILQYLENLKPSTEKRSIGVLLKLHKERRSRVQPFVVAGLERLKATEVLEDIRESCRQAVRDFEEESFDSTQALEKAYWQISSRLNEFIEMEKWVHRENETQKHHEMRILAKKLRYTMEVFAPLYKNKLVNEIDTLKAFQDVLGEMHDSDFWIEYLPKFIRERAAHIKSRRIKTGVSANSSKALLNFLVYAKGRRKSCYKQFVEMWDENKNRDFFVHLGDTARVGLKEAEEKIKTVLANPNVRIAVLADVHANLHALETVFQDAEERNVDVYLNAGDSIGFGACPNKVVELLREKDVLSVLGNYDLEVLAGKNGKGEKRIALEFSREELSKSCEDYLRSLPHEVRFEVAGKKVLLTHGSPESIEEHIYHDTPAERLKVLGETANADVVLVGHSHEQFWRTTNGVNFVNPGSVGRPDDGNPPTAYAILNFNPFKAELIRLDYDVEAAANSLRKKRLPESFAQMLLRGISIDAISKEDLKTKNNTTQNRKEITTAVGEISKTYLTDTEHSMQVAKLALDFFDGLIKVHKLGIQERCWLECAAILHDIGLSKAAKGHHKESAKLILNDTRLPFSSRDRRVIACIARYHRKALPKAEDNILASLDRATVRKVEVLAGSLRVADGLDYSHESKVKNLTVKVSTRRVAVECTVDKGEVGLEEQAFNKKKDLLEKVLAKKLVLVWKQR
jgi:putative phosphoesterase